MANLNSPTTLIAFAIGFILHYLFAKIWPYRHQIYAWIFKTRNYDKIGKVCETDIELDRKGYSLGYSFEHKAPLWVSYIISRASKNIDWDRTENFESDPEIPAAHRLYPEDFSRTGYDKGHLAPSSAIDFSKKSNAETFLMSNVALQHPQLNRQAWRALENKVQDWVQERGRLFVVTGPLYIGRKKLVNKIPLPSHFYKVAFSPKYLRGVAFLFPNKAIKSNEIWSYAVSVKELEELSGYSFFQRFSKRKERFAEELDIEWWQGVIDR